MKFSVRVIMVAAALAASPAAAASFDCGKARTPDEITVCQTPALSQRDSEMGGLWYAYSRVPMMMGSNGARRDDAQQFLAARSQCGRNVSCQIALYDARNAVLRAGIADAMTEMFRLQNAN